MSIAYNFGGGSGNDAARDDIADVRRMMRDIFRRLLGAKDAAKVKMTIKRPRLGNIQVHISNPKHLDGKVKKMFRVMGQMLQRIRKNRAAQPEHRRWFGKGGSGDWRWPF